MVKIINFSPFANLRFTNRDAKGQEFGVFMAKTAMDIPESGQCTFSQEQEPFVLTDEYYEDLNTSALRYPSDFVPYKPHSDVIVDGVAYTPNSRPAVHWDVGVKVEDGFGLAAEKSLRVHGPRLWTPKWIKAPKKEGQKLINGRQKGFQGWVLGESQPIAELPLRYEAAFGGMVEDGRNEDGTPCWTADEKNPVGTGWIDLDLTDHRQPIPAPQIEDPKMPLWDPYCKNKPHGFGPIPPAWLPRRPLGGTYDEGWLENDWPNWATDYDFAFHNAAHPDLQCDRHLEGGLRITLTNLHPDRPVWTFTIPDERLVATAVEADGTVTVLEMVRDTLFLDIGITAGADPRVFSMWRTPFDARNTVTLTLQSIGAAQFHDTGAIRLIPADCACDPALLNPDQPEEAA